MRDRLVLCYHAVSPTWDADLSITPDALERQIDLLARRGYSGCTMSSLLQDASRGRRVVFTFDDAYRSVLELAKPILDRYEMPACVYAVTDFVGWKDRMRWRGIDRWVGGPHEAELAPLDWPDLRDLASAGWEIGSHTRTHPHLTELPDARLEDELAGSRRALEAGIGEPCTTLAYPYGDLDGRVVEAARRAGYTAAVALPVRLGGHDPLAWPRVGVYRRDADLRRFKLKVSRTVRVVRSTPLLGSLRRARCCAG